ncbi:MAG TPA: dTMP kinase [Candidatus Saccharimonadales bacterium]|nr:dTMP kinase [Candidatus Saccharimonadales bacterium]
MAKKSKGLKGGLVIIFEGIDGVGKTTQLELARKELEKAGWPVMTTRNMGGTPIGEALREVIMSPELRRPALTDFYVSLAIQEPLLDVINEARKEGKVVLMDRGPLSLAAYQIYGAGIDDTLGWEHVRRGMDRIKPDAVILYDTEPGTALSRLHKAKADYFESKPLEYFDDVAKGFREAGQRYGAATIDASQSVDKVHGQTMSVIQHLFA